MNPINKILIIRRDNIGDLVCTTPAIFALRKKYPRAKIGALVNSYNAEVLRANPNVDCIFVYQKLKHVGGLIKRIRALIERFKLISRVRRWSPDCVILAKSSYDRHGLSLARQIGSQNIIGYVPDVLSEAKALPDIRLQTPKFTAIHEVVAINQLLAPLGIKDEPGPLQVFPDATAVANFVRQLSAAKQRIALHISAREPERRWGADNFVVLAKHILQTQMHTQILLLWSPGKPDDLRHPGDDEVASELIRKVDCDRLVPVYSRNLTDLIAALSVCDIFIGADGGAMHIAAGLNKKILALFENSPSKLNHWYPWHVDHVMVCSLDGAGPEVGKIYPTQVLRGLDQLW